jgi:hypothetical protein
LNDRGCCYYYNITAATRRTIAIFLQFKASEAIYAPAEIEHCETSKTIMKYINAKTIHAKNTGMTYKTRMQSFAQFIYRHYNKTPGDFLDQIKAGEYDHYDVLVEY